jgi:hypothetical protein
MPAALRAHRISNIPSILYKSQATARKRAATHLTSFETKHALAASMRCCCASSALQSDAHVLCRPHCHVPAPNNDAKHHSRTVLHSSHCVYYPQLAQAITSRSTHIAAGVLLTQQNRIFACSSFSLAAAAPCLTAACQLQTARQVLPQRMRLQRPALTGHHTTRYYAARALLTFACSSLSLALLQFLPHRRLPAPKSTPSATAATAPATPSPNSPSRTTLSSTSCLSDSA